MWDRHVIRRKMNSFARRAGWTRAPAMPISAWVEPTARCNLRCPTCGVDRSVGRFEDMSPAVYERVRRDLFSALGKVCLTSLGEPFLAPIFRQMLNDFLGAGKRVEVITNGTIIDTRILERLVCSPSTLMVSVDGTTREVFEYIRRGARFDRILEFMDTVKRMMDRGAHRAFRFEINFVVTRSNVRQMSECVELAHRYGVRRVCFASFAVGARTDSFALDETLVNSPEEVMPHWTRAHRRARELGISVPPIVFDCLDRPDANAHYSKIKFGDRSGRIRPCPLPWWVTHIDVTGAVRPCCVWQSQPPFGNLCEQPFRHIWNGPQYRALRRTVNTPEMPEFCRRCSLPVRL